MHSRILFFELLPDHYSLTCTTQIEYAPLADAKMAEPMLLEFVELIQAHIPRTPDGIPMGV